MTVKQFKLREWKVGEVLEKVYSPENAIFFKVFELLKPLLPEDVTIVTLDLRVDVYRSVPIDASIDAHNDNYNWLIKPIEATKENSI